MKFLSKPIVPVVIGAVLILAGGFLKILKLPLSDELLILGLVVELFGIVYFIYRYRMLKKNESLNS